MIVDSMTVEEVYDEIDRDLENMTKWWWKKREMLSNMAKRRPNFPMTNWFEWESPRKIRYLAFSKVYGRNYNKNAATIFLVLRNVRNGIEVYTTRLPWQMIADRVVVLPHVFDRYAERADVHKQGLELIKDFFEHNCIGEPTDKQGLVGRSVRYNGEEHFCNCCKNGVMLGKMQDDIYVARTFITYEMASGLQREEFEDKRDVLKTMGQTMGQLRKIYNW